MSTKTALITGITGQDGSYLSHLLLREGYRVYGTTHRDDPDRSRLVQLGVDQKITLITGDLTDSKHVCELLEDIQPHEVYHLAAQSLVSTSLNDPHETLHCNIDSILNICVAIQQINQSIRLFNASSSEIFSPTTTMPLKPDSPIGPTNPYGISKAAGHLLVKFYRLQHGLFAVNGILFPHESPLRQPASFVKSTISQALEIAARGAGEIRLGQVENLRDYGDARRFVEAMWRSLQIESARDYIISSATPCSIRDIASYILKKTGVPNEAIIIDKSLFRSPNITEAWGDNTETKELLNWQYDTDFTTVLDEMITNQKQENIARATVGD